MQSSLDVVFHNCICEIWFFVTDCWTGKNSTIKFTPNASFAIPYLMHTYCILIVIDGLLSGGGEEDRVGTSSGRSTKTPDQL